jgi:hypothetical protein
MLDDDIAFAERLSSWVGRLYATPAH